jgi:hypothetical protein
LKEHLIITLVEKLYYHDLEGNIFPLLFELFSFRIQTDLVNDRCYFSSRTTRSIRILTLENNFPMTTLPVDFNFILPTVDIDFNRIVITPSGDSILLFDRKGPYIVLVSQVLTASPVLSILHTPGSGLGTPLQGACYPILPQHSHNWDCPIPIIPDVQSTNHSSHVTELDRSLEISTELCFVAAGSKLWAVPTQRELAIALPVEMLPKSSDLTLQDVVLPVFAPDHKSIDENTTHTEDDDEDGNSLSVDPSYVPYIEKLETIRTPTLSLCDIAHVYSKFLIHDLLPVTSNSLLILNRHSKNTGLYLLTTSAWKHSQETSFHDSYHLHYLVGSDYVAPHGMTISLDRKQIVIVETGKKEEKGARGGHINVMELHLCVDEKAVRVSDARKLEEIIVTEIDNWSQKVQMGKGIATDKRSLNYEEVYHMDGEEYEEIPPVKKGALGCCQIM